MLCRCTRSSTTSCRATRSRPWRLRRATAWRRSRRRSDPGSPPARRRSGWVDAGRVPPGAQPSEALEARLAGSLESWSCWVFCTGLGALLASAGHDVRIAVEHHRTESIVAFHSVLLVDGQMLDP